MSLATDIAALKARCTALEAKNKTQDAAIAALTARVAALEVVRPLPVA